MTLRLNESGRFCIYTQLSGYIILDIPRITILYFTNAKKFVTILTKSEIKRKTGRFNLD